MYDVARQSAVNIVKAHVGPLAALALSPSGALLATASDSGTLVRVFNLPACEKLHTLRRGTSPVTVSCLAFANLGAGPEEALLLGSTADTVHGFLLEGPYLQRLASQAPLVHSVAAAQAGAAAPEAAPASGILAAVRERRSGALNSDAHTLRCSQISDIVSSVASAGAATVEGTRSQLRLHLPAAPGPRRVLALGAAPSDAGAVLTLLLSTGTLLQFALPPVAAGDTVKLVGEVALSTVAGSDGDVPLAQLLLPPQEVAEGAAAGVSHASQSAVTKSASAVTPGE